jgi:putative tryptophan/tyrosine transport system substrate-binding protein
MRRRDFIAGLSTAVWPLAARAQQPDKVRHIGVLMGFSEQDSEARRWVAAFERKLAELGWKTGIDLRIEYRWPGNSSNRLRAHAAEIVNLNPDAILVSNEPTLAFTSSATRTIPIVFANVTNPRLERHYDNVTGIIAVEPQVAEKWVSVLKELVPGIDRVGFLNVPTSTRKEFFAHIDAAAASHGLKLVPTAASGPRLDTTIVGPEATIAQYAAEPNGGLVVMPSFITAILRSRIHQGGCPVSRAGYLRPSVLRSGRRPDFLWNRYRAVFRSGRVLRRPHPKRRNARRPAATASLSVRSGPYQNTLQYGSHRNIEEHQAINGRTLSRSNHSQCTADRSSSYHQRTSSKFGNPLCKVAVELLELIGLASSAPTMATMVSSDDPPIRCYFGTQPVDDRAPYRPCFGACREEKERCFGILVPYIRC